MAVPLEQFVKQLEESGILAGDTLRDFIPPKAEPKDAEDLARELVRQKKLTKYQAEKVWRGKGKSLVLGNYTILDKIGSGGMGQVFKAEHRRMHRIVAVKMLPAGMLKDAAVVARFEREVMAAAKLNHPNIVTAFDADNANGIHLLIMEYVEGSDLAALVKKHGPLPVDRAVNYILQAAGGLEAAHAAGIVHRDIKPANLLLDRNGVVKILDMGLARLSADADAGQQAELTSTGTIMGTVDYMAPEQAVNTKSADARADIYSLGCSLFYLLAGKATYDGDTLMAKLLAHREQPIPSIRAIRPDVPEQVDAVFSKMVAKNVVDRYQSMTELIADLERLGTVQELPANPQPSLDSSADTDLTNFLRDISLPEAAPVRRKKPAGSLVGKEMQKRLLIGGGILGVLVLLTVLVIRLRTGDGTPVIRPNAAESRTDAAKNRNASKSAARDREAAAWVIANGGAVRLDGREHDIRDVALLPERSFRLTTVNLPESFNGIGLKEALRNLPHVTELAMGGNLVGNSEAGIAADMPELTNVSLTHCPLGDDGMKHLAGHPQIVGLTLYYAVNVGDDGLRHIAGLTKIEGIHVGGTHVTDEGLQYLAAMKRLKYLQADDTKLTGVGFRHLVMLPKLEYVHLANAPISDEGASAIAQVTTLKLLNLQNTQVTDACIDDLSRLSSLERLLIGGARFSPPGVARLKAALPRCNVE